MTMGDRIRTLRLNSGLTLDEVATALGTTKQAIHKYEHNIVTNIPNEKMGTLAAVLKTTPEYLRCITDDARPPEERLELSSVFRKRLAEQLENADSADVEAVFGSASPFKNLIDGKIILSLDDAYSIADSLGVSLDYLTGLVDDPQTRTLSLPDFSLVTAIEDADNELIESVHRICSMSEIKIAEDVALGKLESTWNPQKIKLVQEFIEDSQAVLQKMLANIE